VLDPGYEKFGPAEKIVSMEKHLELRRMIEEIKPNPFVK